MAGELNEFAKLLDTNISKAAELGEKLTGVKMSVPELMNKIQGLNQQLYNLSVSSSALGRDFGTVKDQITTVMRQFNFTAESAIEMQRTLTTGFREPIDDIESFQTLLERSKQIFGNNEAAAKRFIQQLAELDKSSVGLRDNFTKLMMIMGKTDGLKMGSQEELERGAALRDLTKSQIEMKYKLGEIDRDQFFSYMKYINGKNEAETKLLQMTEKVQQSRQATSAMEAALVQGGDSTALANTLGVLNNIGSAVIATGIDATVSSLKAFNKARADTGSKEIGASSQEALKSLIGNYSDVKEAQAKLVEAGFSEAEAKNLIAQNSELIAKRRQEEEKTAININRIQNNMLTSDEKRALITDQIAQRNKTLQQNYDVMKNTLLASVDALKAMAELSAYSGRGIDVASMGISPENVAKQRNQMAQVASERIANLDAGIAEMEEFAKKSNTLNKDDLAAEAAKQISRQKSAAIQTAQLGNTEAAAKLNEQIAQREIQLQKFQETGNADELKFLTSRQEQENDINRMKAEVNKARADSVQQERAAREADVQAMIRQEQVAIEKLQAQNELLQSEISLMDSLAVGIGANAAAREKAAKNLMEQAKQEESIIKDISNARQKAISDSNDATKTDLQRLVAAEQATKLEIEMQKHIATRNNLNKQALDQLKQLREGYLDAINSMEIGAGMFTEIVADQNKNLGALIRTTESVPRVLRTGAGSGGITQATQFGPGGLTGGFGPKSEEYSQHVMTSMDDIQKLVTSLPEQIGQHVGERLAIAAGARPEYTGVIAETAASGQAGTIKALGAPQNAKGVAAAVEAAAASGAAAGVASTKIDTSDMIKEISTTIQRGVVEAVKKGMSAAVSELTKQTSPE
jgi:hypothetical protein